VASADAPARSRIPIPAIVGGVLALAALIAIVLATSGDDIKTHRVDAFVKNTFLGFDEATKTEVVTGVVSGTDFGRGSTNFVNAYPVGQEEALRKPTSITGRFTFLFDEGVIHATARYTLAGTGSKDASFSGRLTFTGGSRKYAHAKGSASLSGRVFGAVVPARSTITIRGQIEY
jgi:hypothetical protein